jgi:RNA polymerase sigma-70 factor, ECF subfamily
MAVAYLHKIQCSCWTGLQVERRCLPKNPGSEYPAAKRPKDAGAGPGHAFEEAFAIDSVGVVVVEDVVVHFDSNFALICLWDWTQCVFADVNSPSSGIIPRRPKKNFPVEIGNNLTPHGVLIPMKAPVPIETSTFEQLMLPHLDSAYNLSHWLLRDPHDAEDAVQDACLRAFRAFGGFRGADGRAWFLTIVRNVCYSRLRKGKREPREVAFEEDLHGSPDASAEANAQSWLEVKSEQLGQALERLSAEYREVIVLHDVEGLSYREISSVAEIPLGTVMSRLARGRGKLQTELATLIQDESP